MQSAYRPESGKSDCPGWHALCLLQVTHLETWPYRDDGVAKRHKCGAEGMLLTVPSHIVGTDSFGCI